MEARIFVDAETGTVVHTRAQGNLESWHITAIVSGVTKETDSVLDALERASGIYPYEYYRGPGRGFAGAPVVTWRKGRDRTAVVYWSGGLDV